MIIRIALSFLRAVRARQSLNQVTPAVASTPTVGGVQLAPGDIAPDQMTVVTDADGNRVFVMPETIIYGSVGPSHVGEHFPSPDSAASSALKEIYGPTMDKNQEFAGNIYRNPDGSYSFSPPNSIGSDRNSDPSLSPVPAGATVVGTYHSHGAGSLPTDELFSPLDKLKASMGDKPSYLLTPSGHLFKYTPSLMLPPAEQAAFPQGRVTRIQ